MPKQHTSGGKERLGGITKQGNRYLRWLLVTGAMAVIRYAQKHGTKRLGSARPHGAPANQGGCRRAGQQDRPHGLGGHGPRREIQRAELVAGGVDNSRQASRTTSNWRGHDDVMQNGRSGDRESPLGVIAPQSARKRLGPDPRRALGPAATPAAQTGRTRDRTRPMLQKRQKVLARAPSTRDPHRPRCKPAM